MLLHSYFAIKSVAKQQLRKPYSTLLTDCISFFPVDIALSITRSTVSVPLNNSFAELSWERVFSLQ